MAGEILNPLAEGAVDWRTNTYITKGTKVISENRIYQATQPHTSSNELGHDVRRGYWELIGSAFIFDVTDLIERIEALENTIAGLEQDIANINIEITNIQNDITNIQNDIEDLQNDKADKLPSADEGNLMVFDNEGNIADGGPKSALPINGDVTGTLGNTSVDRIRAIPVDETNVADNRILAYNSISGVLEFVDVSSIPGTVNPLTPGFIAIDDSTRNNVYTKLGPSFVYGGTSFVAPITSIRAIAYKDAGPNTMDVRIQDITNGNTIAEITGLNDNVETIINLGAISNLPTGESILQVQVRRVGNPANHDCFVDSLLILY